jgi:hypothetical protein
MGACMSSDNEEMEKKKRSQMIDKKLEEDSRRLRRECKILLLGRFYYGVGRGLKLMVQRLWRKWKVDHRQTDEDHPSERLYRR